MRRISLKILFAAVVLSLAGMFLFKFKYEQMKSIVEGAGLDAIDKYLHSSLLSSIQLAPPSTSLYEFPLVTWNNISDYFVFSAFRCRHSNGQSELQQFCAIGFGPDQVPKLECGVVFDLGKEVLSVPGLLTAIRFGFSDSNSAVVEFKCTLSNVRSFHRKPFVFLLRTRDRRNQIAIPIFKGPNPTSTPRFALCVLPAAPFDTDWKAMIEFLAYHSVIGVTDVIVYDYGINFSFLDKIRYVVQSTNGGSLKSLSVIRWDVPVRSQASSALVESDCLYRTSNSTNLTFALNWNQLIVPANNEGIGSIVKSLSSSKTSKASLPSKRCCTDAFDDRRSEKTWPTILRKTLCIPDVDPRHVVHVTPYDDHAPTKMTEAAELLTFASCQGLGLSELVPVFSVWKHSSEILSSKYLHYWKNSNMFSISTDV